MFSTHNNDVTGRSATALLPAKPLARDLLPERLTIALGDGYRTTLYLHRPAPNVQEQGSILYLHGIQSHPGWFMESAALLSAKGYAVYQLTRRGSGDNGVARGHARGASQLLDDLDCACRFVLQQRSSASLHMVGISWGGKWGTCYCLRPGRSVTVQTLTLVAPGIVPRVDVPWTTKAAIAISLLACPRRMFDIPLSDVELFTDNPEMRRYLEHDDLRMHKATARFLYASRQLDRTIADASDGALAMPTSLIMARRDRIIDNEATAATLRRLTLGRVRVTELDAAHTIEFEQDTAAFHRALLESLRTRP